MIATVDREVTWRAGAGCAVNTHTADSQPYNGANVNVGLAGSEMVEQQDLSERGLLGGGAWRVCVVPARAPVTAAAVVDLLRLHCTGRRRPALCISRGSEWKTCPASSKMILKRTSHERCSVSTGHAPLPVLLALSPATPVAWMG
jgi:hypothetical protein